MFFALVSVFASCTARRPQGSLLDGPLVSASCYFCFLGDLLGEFCCSFICGFTKEGLKEGCFVVFRHGFLEG